MRVGPVDPDLPGVGRVEADGEPGQGGLPGPDRPGHPDKTARRDVQGDVG